MTFERWIELAAGAVEGAGVAVIVGGIMLVTLVLSARGWRDRQGVGYRDLRRGIGRAILLGLELLVAADIIRSVAITPTFATVGVLGLLVVVRTVLSFSLEVEGRWPWQRRDHDARP